MLGIIVALPIEARTLTRSPVPLGRAIDLAAGVRLMVTGMGREQALAGAARLHRAGVTALLNWGCAAALRPGVEAGRLLLPAECVLPHGERIGADPTWHRRLATALGALAPDTGPLAGTATVLATGAAKRALADRSGAAAADMESAFLAAWAGGRNLPFAAVRAVADTADTAIPAAVTDATDACGRIDLRRLLAALLGQPGQVPMLLRLGRQFGAARRQLRQAATVLHPLHFCRS
ncbi:adenosylhomocysteine nucleosidase [Methylomarinovum caldicuralii]|uniref:Adenosylhomocysteine nucleosidase n=1 Tax=Methylomarinovum caldicuralii TaxID=438856 RepID=A0AAU9C2Y0_9GAMM|nr:phosphorylase [Methylomarinovum caldicuralii]BCX81540.1 adenosylhomocysteine nucleosidase [Methylomarinovum caldicuralii]